MAAGDAVVAGDVARWLSHAAGAECTTGQPVFSTGTLDSIRLHELVAWVEETYGITVDPRDLSLANFDTAAAVAAFVARKRG